MLFFPPQSSILRTVTENPSCCHLSIQLLSCWAASPAYFLLLTCCVAPQTYSNSCSSSGQVTLFVSAMLYGPLLSEKKKKMHIFCYPTFLVKNSHRPLLEDKILHFIMSLTGSCLVRSIFSLGSISLPPSTSFWSPEEGKFPLFIN